jgi:hypothetical protein
MELIGFGPLFETDDSLHLPVGAAVRSKKMRHLDERLSGSNVWVRDTARFPDSFLYNADTRCVEIPYVIP